MVLTVAALVSATAPTAASADWDHDDDDRPRITRQPTLTGSALVGGKLEAGGAAWTGRSTVATWGWLRCESESLWSCRLIDGASLTWYSPSSADLGKRLRALLIVSNRDGRDFAWSSATSVVAPAPVVVQPAPPSPSAPPAVTEQASPVPAPPAVETPAVVAPPKLMRPAPLVRLRGWLSSRGAHITLLTVRAPRGARIVVSCFGRGCPRITPAVATKLTRLRNYEVHLRAGARLVIRVTRPGFIGKHTVIRIRRGKAPARRDRCLNPGSGKPTACPAA